MGNILQIYKRDNKTYNLTFTDSDSAAIDITGYTVFFTVKESKTDTDANAKISKTVTSHTSPTTGVTQVSLEPADTNLTVKKYYYDIQLKDASGKITTVVSDTFEILQDITIRTS